MTTIAVTGHMDITEESVPLIEAELKQLLSAYEPADLIGVSCVAKGSDSLFARAVVRAGGRLVVVLPSRDYRERKVKPDHATEFDSLVSQADDIVTLPFDTANREAYQAANSVLLERADRVVAVWNGHPPGSRGGGTAEVVQEARAAGLPVDVVWPEGAARQR